MKYVYYDKYYNTRTIRATFLMFITMLDSTEMDYDLFYDYTGLSLLLLVSALLCFETLLHNPYFKANKCINLKIIIDQMYKFGLFFYLYVGFSI